MIRKLLIEPRSIAVMGVSAKRPNFGCRMSMERGCYPAAPHKIKEIKVKVGGGVEAVLKEKFTDAKGKERWR